MLDPEGIWSPDVYEAAMFGIEEFDLIFGQKLAVAVSGAIGLLVSGKEGPEKLMEDLRRGIAEIRSGRSEPSSAAGEAPNRSTPGKRKKSTAAQTFAAQLRKAGIPVPPLRKRSKDRKA